MKSKGSADKISYLDRSGNHGTKPKKLGNNDHLAVDHYEVDYSIDSLVEQRKRLDEIDSNLRVAKQEVFRLQQENENIKLELIDRHDYEKSQFLKKKKAQIGIDLLRANHLMARLSEQRKAFNSEPRGDSYERYFVELARNALPKNVFAKLHSGAMGAFVNRQKLP